MRKLNKLELLGFIIAFAVLFSVIGITFLEYINSNGIDNESNTYIDESKNKIAVVVKKDGIYDTSKIREELSSFLDSIKSDLDIDNIGVCRADVDSLDDLDQIVENLYYEDDVGYIILVGRNLAWEGDGWKELQSDIQSAFWHVNDELCYLEEREPDEQGKPLGSSEIRNIAISWIMAPDICFNDKSSDEINDMKKEIVSSVISTYTSYHNNPRETLNQFNQSCLYIYMSDALITFYNREFDNRYQFNWILVINTQYDKVWEEMQKKHLILDYFVHGTSRTLMINQSESEAFTTVEDYANFIEENGIPALFVNAGACESKVFQYDCPITKSGIYYCWPQVNICNGVWAYYSMLSPACKALSTTSPFIGHVLRHYQTQTIVFGDITAHMI